ncbi:MAG TPA: hypothetical protein VMQ58_02040 [Candidatus Saccharimonadales bacterium]|nr:hypothetical protein [Candidatus Saccharimonadales bacterium]
MTILSDAMIDANKLIPTQQILSLNVPNSKDLEIEHKNKKEQIEYIN